SDRRTPTNPAQRSLPPAHRNRHRRPHRKARTEVQASALRIPARQSPRVGHRGPKPLGSHRHTEMNLLPLLLAPVWYQTDFPPDEFRARWSKIFDRMGTEAVVAMQGVAQTRGFIMPRQTNEFYYLCGIETPHSYLLLDGRSRKATLYLPPRNPRLEAAEGKVLSADDAPEVKRLTGVDEVLSADIMRDDWLGQRPGGAPRTIYTLLTPAEGNSQARYELSSANSAIVNDYWDGRVSRELNFAQLLRARYPRATIADITPILDELRSV